MGGDMVKRLVADGHEVVGHDIEEASVAAAVEDGAEGAHTLEEVVEKLDPPRVVWVMVPHGEPTEGAIDRLLDLLEPDDVIVDGGNSRFTDSMAAADRCRREGVGFLDVGVSGGVWGLEEGYSMMIGGPADAFQRLEPAFRTLAPEDGYAHVGASGAGHFVKMIHNAIEYGMLQAIGEGFECLQRSEFDVDLQEVAELWQNGAVIRCWLLELLARAFDQEGNELERIAAHVDDSGMGRWSVHYAVENGIPLPALTDALYGRFDSRIEERFSDKVIAALRNQFGGHEAKEEEGGS